MCGLGIRGLLRGCMSTWCGSRSPLRRLHGAQEATMLSHPERAALGARDHVVDGQRGARAAVLARPAVAGEHGAARDLPLVRVARDLHVGDEPDHDRLGERAVGPVQRLAADLDHLGLLLQEQDRGAPHGAHVDGLVRRVEHQHTTTRPTASAVGTRSVPRVVSGRHRPQWAWWYSCRHDLAECSYGADGNEPSTRTPSAWERSAPIAWATARIVRAAGGVDEEHVRPRALAAAGATRCG